MAEEKKARTLTGKVVSDKMDKSIVVMIERHDLRWITEGSRNSQRVPHEFRQPQHLLGPGRQHRSAPAATLTIQSTFPQAPGRRRELDSDDGRRVAFPWPSCEPSGKPRSARAFARARPVPATEPAFGKALTFCYPADRYRSRLLDDRRDHGSEQRRQSPDQRRGIISVG